MKAQETTVLRLLQGSKVFLIPNFQRRYAWRRQQWQELWDDVVREYETDHDDFSQELDGHFLGSVVLHPAPGPASTLMRHLVIDGQQRLTTLIVLLAALRDVRAAADPGWNPASYDAKYLTNPFDEDYPDRLVPTEFDREPYIQTVRHGRPTGGIGQAYTYFRERIEEASAIGDLDLSRVGDVILIHMLLVEINTSTGDSVNNIFNTLNSKGLPLSPTDLVRNELLLNLSEEAATDAYQRLWLPMERNLVRTDSNGNPKDGLFITFFWAREVAHNTSTTKKNLFQSFERRLRKTLEKVPAADRQRKVQQLFNEIYEDFVLYRSVLDPFGNDESKVELPREMLQALEDLRSWGSEPYVPIALWVLRGYANDQLGAEDAIEVLRTLLGYLVRRAMFGLSTNNLNRLLTPVPTQLESRKSGTAHEALVEILMRSGYRWPGDADVLNNVASQPVYLSIKRAQTKFLLEFAERLQAGNEVVDMSRLTIEHVMPQSLPRVWRDDLAVSGDDLDEAEAVLHTLGNLTLTAHNTRLSDSSFAAKRALFVESPLRLNVSVASHDAWTVGIIRERSHALAELLLTTLVGPPRSQRNDAVQANDDDLRDRLAAALQSLPEGAWTSDEELVKLLGADSPQLHFAVGTLGAEIARLVRTSTGEVPGWFVASLREKVLAQSETTLPAAGFTTAIMLAASALADEDPSWDEAMATSDAEPLNVADGT